MIMMEETMMYKMMQKFFSHWTLRFQKNGWYILLFFAEIMLFVGIWFKLCNIASNFLPTLSYFSKFSANDIEEFLILLSFLMIALLSIQDSIETKKTIEKLKNRPLVDYEEKYSEYVDLINHVSRASNYENLPLSKDWVKLFDKYLSELARLCRRQERDFTDFEVASCLMYALIYPPKVQEDLLFIDFAFQCVSQLISHPHVYQCNYLEGDELKLEPINTYVEVPISELHSNTFSPFIVEILKQYLWQRDTYQQFLSLADFLQALYMRCDDLQA